MGSRQHEECTKVLQELNYFVHLQQMNSCTLGLPQDRQRIYFICVHSSAMLDLLPSQFNQIMETTLDCLTTGHKEMELNQILLPVDDPHVVCATAQWKALPDNNALIDHAAQCQKDTAKQPLWIEDHFNNLKNWTPTGRRRELAGPTACLTGSPDSFEKFAALRSLTMRELDVLMHEAPHLPATANKAEIIDLSQSVTRVLKRSRSSDGVTRTNTVTPNSVLFHTFLGRKLLGVEKLRLVYLLQP
jgi:site-specific DNA-cytosine methylase